MKKFKPFIPFIIVFLVSDIIKIVSLHIYIEWLSIFLNLFVPSLLIIWYIKKTGYNEFLLNKNNFSFLIVALVFTLSFDFIWDPILNIRNVFNDSYEFHYKFNNTYWKPEITSALLIYAPIVESILIIALLQKPLEKYVPLYVALVISAIIFSAIHRRDFSDSLFCFFTGMIYGFSYLKTRNITIPILCHLLVNLIYNCQFLPNKLDTAGILLLCTFFICFIASFIYLLRYNKKPSSSWKE